MKHLVLVGIGLAVLGFSNVRGEDKPHAAARERVELAQRIYRERILSGLVRRAAPPQLQAEPMEDPVFNEAMAEDLHRWSDRWMDAECDVAPDRAGRVAAAQAHLGRMRSIEQGKMVRKELADHPLVKDLDERKISIVDIDIDELRKMLNQPGESLRRYLDVARYFRLEAEARLLRETNHCVVRTTATG